MRVFSVKSSYSIPGICEFQTDISGRWKLWMPLGVIKRGLSAIDNYSNHPIKESIVSNQISFQCWHYLTYKSMHCTVFTVFCGILYLLTNKNIIIDSTASVIMYHLSQKILLLDCGSLVPSWLVWQVMFSALSGRQESSCVEQTA